MSDITKAVEFLIIQCKTLPIKFDMHTHELSTAQDRQQADSLFAEWNAVAENLENELRHAGRIADEQGIPSDAIFEAVSQVRNGSISEQAFGQLERLRVKASDNLPTEPGDWVSVRIEDCDCSPSTLFRKSKEPNKTGVRTLGRGEYQIQREWLNKLLKQERRHKYQ